jgi:pilus assembly protein Flp/PilA
MVPTGTERTGATGRDGAEPGRIRAFARDRRGSTAMEYAMIGALIFAVAAGTIKLYGSKMNDVYGRIGSTAAQIN